MKVGSKARLAVVGGSAAAALASVLSVAGGASGDTAPSPEATSPSTPWRSLDGCAIAATSTWALGCAGNGWDEVFAYLSGWAGERGVGRAITLDGFGYTWAVGYPSEGVFIGYNNGSYLAWAQLTTPLLSSGQSVWFTSVAAGWPEYGAVNGGQVPKSSVQQDQVWATDATGEVWAWNGSVSVVPFSASISSDGWTRLDHQVPGGGAQKVAMQSEKFPTGSVCIIPIAWAMNLQGELYQYSLTQRTLAGPNSNACVPTGTCTGGCWVDMNVVATDISSGDYLLDQNGLIYQWTQGSGCSPSAPCGGFGQAFPLPSITLDSGVAQTVPLYGIGAPTSPQATGGLSAIDNNGGTYNVIGPDGGDLTYPDGGVVTAQEGRVWAYAW